MQSCRSPLSTGLGYVHSCCVSVCMGVGEGVFKCMGGICVWGGCVCICIVFVCERERERGEKEAV